jgi:hypothetical protein
MIRRGTVLLLGAGASAPYGFPLVRGLKNKIIAFCKEAEPRCDHFHLRRGALPEFGEAFRQSPLVSIDRFLELNPRFHDAGRKMISAVLLIEEGYCKQHEFQVQRTSEGIVPGDLYDYLWDQIARPARFDDLDLSVLKVVTFNYDRSLEAYLLRAMVTTYEGVDKKQAAEKLRHLEVAHVHGSLGSVDPDSPNAVPFGADWKTHLIEKASESVRVISQSRADADEVKHARKLLADANHIAILGFGFDERNLEILDAETTLSQSAPAADEGPLPRRRTIAASCYGMTARAAQTIMERYGTHNAHGAHQPRINSSNGLPTNFWNADSVQTLKETLILGE